MNNKNIYINRKPKLYKNRSGENNMKIFEPKDLNVKNIIICTNRNVSAFFMVCLYHLG